MRPGASGSNIKLVAEGNATVTREIATDWGLTGGVIFTVLPDPTISIQEMSVRQDLPMVAPQVVVGVSHRL
ncbi:MAG TPA: hypothetical protein VGM90_34725 [Kofleriaceae bacterium]